MEKMNCIGMWGRDVNMIFYGKYIVGKYDGISVYEIGKSFPFHLALFILLFNGL
jgi:hypothetical protein